MPEPESPGRVVADQPLLVVIPGLLASHLADVETGRRLWPPNLFMLVRGWRMHALARPLPYQRASGEPELSATDIVLSRPRRDYYSSLLDALTSAGYACASQHAISAGTNCVLFAWDWRRGFVAAAAELDAVLDRIASQRGEPPLRVDIVAHSAGAMVARYFAGFGGTDVLDAATRARAAAAEPRVRRIVLIGPPNRGSIFGAYSLMRGYSLGLFTVQPEVLATFDTAYELLPHPEREWVIDALGEPLPIDLYDTETWRRFEVSIYDPAVRARVRERLDSGADAERHLEALERRFARGLERGRRFHAALSSAGLEVAARDYLIVGSTCESTPRYFVSETVEGGEALRLAPSEVRGLDGIDYAALMHAPGDSRVTRSSLLGLTRADGEPFAATFVCDRHSEITSNPRVQYETLRFLLN